MKITFISPYYSNIWEQLGVGYIASYCKHLYKGDLELKFYHENFDLTSDIIDYSSDSDIVALSCTTPTFQRGVLMARLLKQLNSSIHTVMGGWHTTTSRKNPNKNYIDQIVIGEGEEAFLSILKGKRKKIVYGKKLDFTDLYWPDREFINQKRQLDYCEKNFGERIGSFISRRGCPMSCSICGEHCMSEGNLRIRDSEDVLDEIESVNKEYNLSKFKFCDPTWNYPVSAAITFCEQKIKRQMTLPWEGMGHASFITKDLLKLMKKANCEQINIGCESGNQEILNEIGKGTTPSKIKQVFKWGKEIGIQMRGFFIVGLPNETQETIEETKQLIRDISPDVFGITLMCPYPGTKYYKDEYENVRWSYQGEYDNDIWQTKNFNNMELREIIKDFNNEFYDKLVTHQKRNI